MTKLTRVNIKYFWFSSNAPFLFSASDDNLMDNKPQTKSKDDFTSDDCGGKYLSRLALFSHMKEHEFEDSDNQEENNSTNATE